LKNSYRGFHSTVLTKQPIRHPLTAPYPPVNQGDLTQREPVRQFRSEHRCWVRRAAFVERDLRVAQLSGTVEPEDSGKTGTAGTAGLVESEVRGTAEPERPETIETADLLETDVVGAAVLVDLAAAEHAGVAAYHRRMED